jgi:tRNA threonylcarbamoyladenosine biosynthesis protein TsaB
LFLAIETSQRAGSVALRAGDGAVLEESLSPKKRHDDDLLPAIDRLFTRTGLRSDDLRGGTVAASIGPGGFTGLRIAVATAKMLAEALQAQLVAVPSALVAAESHAGRGPLLIALACKGDTFWLTRVDRQKADQGGWRIVGEPGMARSSDFDFSGVRTVIADEHFPEAARSRLGGAGVEVIEPRFSARSCLMVGERMRSEGAITDPLLLLPLYPREPEAVSLWRQRSSSSNR